MERGKINLDMSMQDAIALLSEGNGGAGVVLANILYVQGADDALFSFLDLDDMNIRGSQIWNGFLYCEEDLIEFIEAVKRHDVGMIEAINKASHPGHYQAVVKGATKMVPRPTLG